MRKGSRWGLVGDAVDVEGDVRTVCCSVDFVVSASSEVRAGFHPRTHPRTLDVGDAETSPREGNDVVVVVDVAQCS